jgi:hypothetical protein
VNSGYGGDMRKQKLVSGCERGGVYKPTQKKLKFAETGTRKCGRPFRLRGYFHATKECYLNVVSGIHNHKLDKELDSHLVERLKPQEKEVVAEMTKNPVPPKNIMTTLKERDLEYNVTGIKQLYTRTSSNETLNKGAKE